MLKLLDAITQGIKIIGAIVLLYFLWGLDGHLKEKYNLPKVVTTQTSSLQSTSATNVPERPGGPFPGLPASTKAATP